MKLLKAVLLVGLLSTVNTVIVVHCLAPNVGAGPTATMNGDVNGDGDIDVSDPVYLLNWLYLQGPSPVAIAGPPQLSSTELAKLQDILPHLTVESLPTAFEDHDGDPTTATIPVPGQTAKTVVWSGVNLQVVNGTGATDNTENSLGNVIVGYLEPGFSSENLRTGSHNMVVGAGHQYLANSGLISGANHTVTGEGSAAIGGAVNVVGVNAATIGGVNNEVGTGSVIIGSLSSIATGGVIIASAGSEVADGLILGGSSGLAANNGVLVGGNDNQATGNDSVVVGGEENTATGIRGVVVGGSSNEAVGIRSTALGGSDNSATGFVATTCGGQANEAAGNRATVGGGLSRTAPADHDWAAGSLLEDQ